MTSEGRFATLRSLLTQEASAELWQSLMELFEEWEHGAELVLALQYAEQHLQHWPHRWRVFPKAWTEILMGGSKAFLDRKWKRGERAHPAIVLSRVLSLSNFQLQEKHFRFLKKEPLLSGITHLMVDGSRMDDDIAYELSLCEDLDSLTHASFNSNSLGPQGIWDLAESPLFSQLKYLRMEYNYIGYEGIRGLAECAGLQGLEELSVYQACQKKESLALLLSSPNLVNLRRLRIGGHFYDENRVLLQALQESERTCQLEYLDLSYTGERDFAAILEMPLESLKGLNLSGNQYSDEEARKLNDSGLAESLEVLVCNHCSVSFLDTIRPVFGNRIQTEFPTLW